MKRGTPQHPKVADLASSLKIETYAAVGLLELLWEFAGDYAPRGDVGRHSDESIAKALTWRKKPAALIQALIDTKWLDTSEVHRLVVHDWRDHCEDFVHNKLSRARETFCDGSVPKTTRLPMREREEAERFYASRDTHASAHDALYGLGVAGLGKAKCSEGGAGGNHSPSPPVDADPPPTPPPPPRRREIPAAASPGGEYVAQAFPQFWARYPRQVDRDSVMRAWLSVVTPEALDDGRVWRQLEAYERSDEWARGVVAAGDRWLFDRARSNWQDRPPPARSAAKTAAIDQQAEEFAKRTVARKGVTT